MSTCLQLIKEIDGFTRAGAVLVSAETSLASAENTLTSEWHIMRPLQNSDVAGLLLANNVLSPCNGKTWLVRDGSLLARESFTLTVVL